MQVDDILPDAIGFEELSKNGVRALWVGFAGMTLFSLIFVGLSWKVPLSRRIYHVLVSLTLIVSALSYLAMATGYGEYDVCHEHHPKKSHKHHPLPGIPELHCRTASETRYWEWAISSTLLIVTLSLVAGLGGARTLIAVFADWVILWTGSVAVNHHPRSRGQGWIFVVIGAIAYLTLVWQLAYNGFKAAKARGTTVRNVFVPLVAYLAVVWTVEIAIWAVAQGGDKIKVNSETYAYLILDVLREPVLGLWLLISYRTRPDISLDLNGYWSQGAASEGLIRLGPGNDDEA